ncbi:MAG TPA: hypothetical protein VN914_10705 [Polyangia bacterium]|nr:hypothetical protein [Polyangia bacterium]
MDHEALPPARPSTRGQLAAPLLTLAGLALLGIATLDWIGYTAFSISLSWR